MHFIRPNATSKNNMEIEKKIIHDINSDLSTLSQALKHISNLVDSDTETSKKMLTLSIEKTFTLIDNWEKVKTLIKK